MTIEDTLKKLVALTLLFEKSFYGLHLSRTFKLECFACIRCLLCFTSLNLKPLHLQFQSSLFLPICFLISSILDIIFVNLSKLTSFLSPEIVRKPMVVLETNFGDKNLIMSEA